MRWPGPLSRTPDDAIISECELVLVGMYSAVRVRKPLPVLHISVCILSLYGSLARLRRQSSEPHFIFRRKLQAAGNRARPKIRAGQVGYLPFIPGCSPTHREVVPGPSSRNAYRVYPGRRSPALVRSAIIMPPGQSLLSR